MSIVGDRNKTHGDPVPNMEAIADEWNGYLGSQARWKLSGYDVARMMALLHVVRDRKAPVPDPAHLEHQEGYEEIAEMCLAKSMEERTP